MRYAGSNPHTTIAVNKKPHEVRKEPRKVREISDNLRMYAHAYEQARARGAVHLAETIQKQIRAKRAELQNVIGKEC